MQVLDVKVTDGTAGCTLKVAAGSEVLVTAAYVVKGKLESDDTTIQY